jgi:hypothetical protein
MTSSHDGLPTSVDRRLDTSMAARKKSQDSRDKPVSLKILADYLGLCPATVSVVLNNVPGRSIPQETRERVRAALRKFNDQPSLVARSLRKQRTFTVGVLVPELSDGYHTLVMSGTGDHLMTEGYFYFSAHHRHQPSPGGIHARATVQFRLRRSLAKHCGNRSRTGPRDSPRTDHPTRAGPNLTGTWLSGCAAVAAASAASGPDVVYAFAAAPRANRI